MTRLLLSENLPLRTTRMLGDFAVDQVLPRRYGDLRNTRFPLLMLTQSDWLAADHNMFITAVYVNSVKTVSYDTELRNDSLGNSWIVVRLAAPAPLDAEVSASGIGLLDPRTGLLIENPAAIMEDLLRLAGRTETFPLLRAECAAADITLAGSIDKLQSILAWLDEIAYSTGAMWTPEAARLYPTTVVQGYVASLDRYAATELKANTNLEDTADVLRVSFDWNGATEQPQQFVELTASPKRFGGLPKEVVLRWLRKATNAESVGRRMLQRMAGIRYNVTHSSDQVQLRPCTWTSLVANPEWPIPGDDPVAMIVKVDVNDNLCDVRSEVIASTPTITVTAHSVALPSTTTAALAAAIADGVLTLSAFDENGKPIQDALISLDGSAAKKTNKEGKVQFSVTPSNPPKNHQVVFKAPGFAPQFLVIPF